MFLLRTFSTYGFTDVLQCSPAFSSVLGRSQGLELCSHTAKKEGEITGHFQGLLFLNTVFWIVFYILYSSHSKGLNFFICSAILYKGSFVQDSFSFWQTPDRQTLGLYDLQHETNSKLTSRLKALFISLYIKTATIIIIIMITIIIISNRTQQGKGAVTLLPFYLFMDVCIVLLSYVVICTFQNFILYC